MRGAALGGGVKISATAIDDGWLVSAGLATTSGLSNKQTLRRIFWNLFFMVCLYLRIGISGRGNKPAMTNWFC